MVAEHSWKRRIPKLAAASLWTALTCACLVSAARGAVDLPQCRTGPGDARPADVYVPMDSWIYPALDRLHGLGYLDTGFLGLRPWTRRSIQRMLDQTAQEDEIQKNPQAQEILAALQREFGSEDANLSDLSYGCEGVYTRLQGISGLTLRDSFHLGQTLVNDYGRPYQPGFNTVDGVSGSAEFGRFSLYARGEYQHAPSASGYSPALVTTLSTIDQIPLASNPVQVTIPAGPIASTDVFRILEANLSYRILNHEISFGKSDHWFAPTVGGASCTATTPRTYMLFRSTVSAALYPALSRVTGPFRYDFFVGSLKGHSDPNDPWMHSEKINFKPTPNIEFGFSRSTIWGGKGHVPITIHSFLKSFFSSKMFPLQKRTRGTTRARDLALSTSVGGFRFSRIVSLCTQTHLSTMTSARSTLRDMPAFVPASTYPVSLAFRGWISGWRVSIPIRKRPAARVASICTGRMFKCRGTPTRDTSWAMPSVAKGRAARHG